MRIVGFWCAYADILGHIFNGCRGGSRSGGAVATHIRAGESGRGGNGDFRGIGFNCFRGNLLLVQ